MPFRVQRKRASCGLRHTTTEKASVALAVSLLVLWTSLCLYPLWVFIPLVGVYTPCGCLYPLWVLLETVWILKTREVYTPLRGAQTVGVCAYLKILIDIFCGARQESMGKNTLLRCITPFERGYLRPPYLRETLH